MPKSRRNCTKRNKRMNRNKRTNRTNRNKRMQNGGNLGRIPGSATVSIQQDEYSPRILVDTETAQDIFDARGAYLL